MFPSRTFKEPSAIALVESWRQFARSQHGGTPAAPQINNGELMQMAEFFRAHSVPGWDKLARIALGFFRPGDKFQAGRKFSKVWIQMPVGAALLPTVWGKATGMAALIDATEKGGVEFTPSVPTSKAFWDFMAAKAFTILKAERAKGIAPKPKPKPEPAKRDPRIIKPPPIKKPPPVPVKPGKGLLSKVPPIALIAIAVLLLARKR